MTTASPFVHVVKYRTVFGVVAYVAVLGAGVWLAVASLGVVGTSMGKLVPAAPRVTGEPGYTWVPLPPVLHPPPLPKRDRSVRRADMESSFVTLSGSPSTLDTLSGPGPSGLDTLSPNAQSDSFVTLGEGVAAADDDPRPTDLVPEPFMAPLAAPAPLGSP